MLKNEMENDGERLIQMLQESLTTAHDENILALNKAHEQEVCLLIYNTLLFCTLKLLHVKVKGLSLPYLLLIFFNQRGQDPHQ